MSTYRRTAGTIRWLRVDEPPAARRALDRTSRSEALEHVTPALVLDVELGPEPVARHRRDLSEKAEDTVLDRSLALVSFPAGS